MKAKPITLGDAQLYTGDALAVLRSLPDESVQTCITSPPYWSLRDYQVDGQLGLEATPDEYIDRMVQVFREVRRVLRDDGTLWLNLGDSYCASPNAGTGWESSTLTKPNGRPRQAQIAQQASMRKGREFPGLKQKDLVGIPWMVAFALRADGWYLRQDIIWHKPSPMPESVRDRCTKAHEYIFLLSKSARYYYDRAAISEPVSLDSHARYARGRSNSHKWADGGPGNQTIAKSFDHMIAPGVNPKAKVPSGWDTGPGDHREKRGRYTPRQNESFSAAVGRAGPTPPDRDILGGPQDCDEPVKRSGNKARKPASARGVPADTGGKASGAVAGSVPWEGTRRNKRSVWTVAAAPFPGAHFATFPPDLIRPCVLAGAPPGGIVLDPFSGSGTTGQVALEEGRKYVGIELNPEYHKLAVERITPAARQPRLIV